MKMKIRLFPKTAVLLVFGTLALLSCSDDDGPVTENEIAMASGTYILTELNVNPAQDIDGDGTASTNLLDELSCISGALNLRSNGTYSLNLTGIEVTSITGGQFFIDCGEARNSDSNWNIQNGLVTLFADVTTTPYSLVGEELTRTLGEDLPGIQSVVYVKQ
ncbi:hypothetical protein ACKWCA_16455 [Maribacter sp. 2307UL18-2]